MKPLLLAGTMSASLLLAPILARAASETVVYSFKGGSDGIEPYAGLIDVGGTLYGTTEYGGLSANCGDGGCGTVFKVTRAGAETVIYAFTGPVTGGNDGALPAAGLINAGGTLYGTTYFGGAGGTGTVFKVTRQGAETVLYSFMGGGDGAFPQGTLIKLGGTFYGTTAQGGANNNDGTVFKVTKAGAENVLHSFGSGSDGINPFAGLIDVGGTLYGTTGAGGAGGRGTVFKVTKAGAEKIVYAFKGGSDGAFPDAGLIDVDGTLYGTTSEGGGSANCNGVSYGCGTVFKVTQAGAETVVYAFQGGSDGAYPNASLIDVGGTLYSTTFFGGANNIGTVFEVTAAGAETVVYSFKGGRDGAYPDAGLIDVGGKLYGTTVVGGADNYGTVFKVTP